MIDPSSNKDAGDNQMSFDNREKVVVEDVDILDAVERANYVADSIKYRLSANAKSRALYSVSVGGLQSTEVETKLDNAGGKKSFINPSGRKSAAIPELADEEMSMEFR